MVGHRFLPSSIPFSGPCCMLYGQCDPRSRARSRRSCPYRPRTCAHPRNCARSRSASAARAARAAGPDVPDQMSPQRPCAPGHGISTHNHTPFDPATAVEVPPWRRHRRELFERAVLCVRTQGRRARLRAPAKAVPARSHFGGHLQSSIAVLGSRAFAEALSARCALRLGPWPRRWKEGSN